MLKRTIVITTRTIKDRKISFFVYLLISVLLMWMYIALYPSIQAQAAKLTEAYAGFTDNFLAAFGVDQLLFGTIEGFLSLEYYSIIWQLMVILMMSGVAAAALAGQIEKGTIELVLAHPISRVNYFLGKYLAGLALLASFTVISVFSVVPLAKLYNVNYQLGHHVAVALIGFLFGWAILSLSLLFASFLKEKSGVFFLSGGVLLLMYVASIVARLKESLANLKYVSFFSYFNQEVLTQGEIKGLTVVVFVGVALVTTALAIWYWHKRDIPV